MDGTPDHVTMRVGDLERSLDWYQRHLEYEEKYRDDVDGTTTVGLGPESMHEDGALLELVPSESGSSSFESHLLWFAHRPLAPGGESGDAGERTGSRTPLARPVNPVVCT